MSDAMTPPSLAGTPERLFVRGPLFDVVMQWAWLPFLLWLMTTSLMGSPTDKAYRCVRVAMVAR